LNAVAFKKVFTVLMKFEATQGKVYLASDLEKNVISWNSVKNIPVF
jgi:hypothetical protein